MQFSVVIPTYKRPDELKRCLTSLFAQSELPFEVLVIDDDDLSVDVQSWARQQCERLGIHWVYQSKKATGRARGTSQSRNLALSLVQTSLMMILDDDLVLDGSFCSTLVSTYREKKEDTLLGVGGVIENNRHISRAEFFYRRMFGLGSRFVWDVNSVGYQVWNDGIQETTKGYYAHGGVFLYSVSVLRVLGGFTEFSEGRNALEDVDLFLHAKQSGYHVWVEPKARVLHEHSPTARASAYKTGIQEMQNRRSILSQRLVRQSICVYWAHVGWILKAFLSCRFKKGFGLLVGVFL